MFFMRCGGQVGCGEEVLILILTETYNSCNFPGGGGGQEIRTPTSAWIHNSEIKRISRNDGCSPNLRE